MSPNAWGGGGLRGLGRSRAMSTAVHRSPNKLWRSDSIFNLWEWRRKNTYRLLNILKKYTIKPINNNVYFPVNNFFLNLSILKKLHQGNLHPKLQVLGWQIPAGNRIWDSAMGGEHSRKEPVNSYIRNIWARDQWRMLATIHITRSCFTDKFEGNNSLLN